MDFCLFCLLLYTLHSVKGAGDYYTLTPNVLVVIPEKGNPTAEVSLQCGDSYNHDDITWRIQGQEFARGNQVNITVEEMLGGNYTCHSHSGALLNHTLVLVQAANRKILDSSHDPEYIQCSSKNYSGVFQCSWKWSKDRNGQVLLVTAARSSAEITCDLDVNGSSVTCRDHSHCPYSEEMERIAITLYVQNVFRVERYTQTFFIAEIVKPDKIRVTAVDQETFKWEYPETWSTPDSYFPLTFQVKMVPQNQSRDCEFRGRCRRRTTLKTTQDLQWPVRKGFLFCVRAQDMLCNSTWSEWSLVGPSDTFQQFIRWCDFSYTREMHRRQKHKSWEEKASDLEECW
ncbi:hypothetical protein GJAV_G00196240 [Gymnothorax javanicus]|nr:hypothetical protein GJAV_G00196240 [Gymnothorax javanicus]